MIKRGFDIVASAVGLVCLLPVLVPVMLILRFTGEGEIFYRQPRIGRNGREFGLLKFATMLKDSPNLPGGYLTTEGDPRILPFGRFLRSTKLNELPQLVNILVGDMSIIGPRPQAPPHFEVFPEDVKKEIILVRPGLSGIGSIFFRNEEVMLRNVAPERRHEVYANDIAPYKGALEVWYVRNASLWLDMKLIFLTLWVVLFPRSRLHHRMLKDLPPIPAQLSI